MSDVAMKPALQHVRGRAEACRQGRCEATERRVRAHEHLSFRSDLGEALADHTRRHNRVGWSETCRPISKAGPA